MPCLRIFRNLHIGLIHYKIKLQSFNDYDHELQINLIYWTRSTFCYDAKLKSLNTFLACVKTCGSHFVILVGEGGETFPPTYDCAQTNHSSISRSWCNDNN